MRRVRVCKVPKADPPPPPLVLSKRSFAYCNREPSARCRTELMKCKEPSAPSFQFAVAVPLVSPLECEDPQDWSEKKQASVHDRHRETADARKSDHRSHDTSRNVQKYTRWCRNTSPAEVCLHSESVRTFREREARPEADSAVLSGDLALVAENGSLRFAHLV